MGVFIAPHIRKSASSSKSAQKDHGTIDGGKRKNWSVKPQNMGASAHRPQCPFFGQTATRSLSVGRFSHDKPLIHRVIHRSCGAERNLWQVKGREMKGMKNFRDLTPLASSASQSNCGYNLFNSASQYAPYNPLNSCQTCCTRILSTQPIAIIPHTPSSRPSGKSSGQ